MTTQPMYFHATMSSNRKTGPMLVTTTSANTCPDTCKHKQLGTCYADLSWLGLHWRKVTSGERSISFETLLDKVRELKPDSMWRWAQAGDLPGIGGEIDSRMFKRLVQANFGKRGFTYTHKPLTTANLDLIHYANQNGFIVNISCDSIDDAVTLKQKLELLGYKIPITVTVPLLYKDYGDVVKICPAQKYDNINCLKCGWCAVPERKFIVGFLAHGSKRFQFN